MQKTPYDQKSLYLKLVQLYGLTKKFFLNIIRDKPLLVWSFGYPLLIIVIFAGAFNSWSGEFQYDIALINNDTLPLDNQTNTTIIADYGEYVIQAFNNESNSLNSTFKVYMEFNETNAKELVNNKALYATLILPANFSEVILSGENVTYELYLTNDPSAQYIISSIIQKTIVAIASNSTYNVDVDINAPLVSVSNRDYLLPAMVIGAVIVSIMTVAGLFAQEKELKLLQRMDTTPVSRKMHFIAGTVSQLTFNAIQIIIMLGVIAFMGIQVHPDASWLLAFLVTWVFSLICIGIGLILAAFVQTSDAAGGVAWIFILPLQVFGGMFNIQFPESVTKFIPTTYGVRAIRDVLINGLGFSSIFSDLIFCFGLGIGLIIIGIVLFEKKTSV